MQAQTIPAADTRPLNEVIGGVYFIQAEDDPDGLIKIGYSEDCHNRLKNHQCGAPSRLRILGIIPNVSPDIEVRLHRRFSEARVHGEWFKPTDLLRRLIDGDANFLLSLVTASEAGHLLRIPQSVVDRELDEYGYQVGPRGGWRYFLEDVELIADRIEEERIRRVSKRVAELVRRRVANAAREAASPDGVAECVEQALSEA